MNSSLNPRFNPRLLKDFIGKHPRHNSYGNREFIAIDRAVPNFMASRSLPYFVAALREQNIPQLRVEPTAHLDVEVAGSYLLKTQTTGRVKTNAIQTSNFRGNGPDPVYQRLVGISLCCNAKSFAIRYPHAAFRVVNNFDSKNSLTHDCNIAPAIAQYKKLCYLSVVSKEMESKDSLVERKPAPDSTAVFLRPGIRLWLGGRQIYKTRKGKSVRLAQPRSLTSQPPCWMRVKTFQQGFLSLVEERFMSQSAFPEVSSAVIPFDFEAHTLRVVMRDGNPWFIAKDVCIALGYKNTSDAIATHLDDDERYSETLYRGGSQVLINESGLYALVLRSHKPAARKFAKWVTSEVLPAIRKTGQYSSSAPTLLNRRWLVSYDHTGKEQVTAIPDDAFVMSIPEIFKALNDPGMLIETEVLFEFCIKAMERLKGRASFLKQKSLTLSKIKDSRE